MEEKDIESMTKKETIAKTYYTWTCPICGKTLKDQSKTRLFFNAKVHLLTHEKE